MGKRLREEWTAGSARYGATVTLAIEVKSPTGDSAS